MSNSDMTQPEALEPSSASRRNFLKRTAVVGGTLVWAAPVVQSIGGAARAVGPNGSEQPGDPTGHFTLSIGGSNRDAPTVQLTNQSSTSTKVVEFSLQINRTGYAFDRINVFQGPVGGFNVVSPSDGGTAGGVRNKLLRVLFSPGLPQGSTDGFTAEMDFGAAETTTNYRNVLVNVSAAQGGNASYFVKFSNGNSYSGTLVNPVGSAPISVSM